MPEPRIALIGSPNSGKTTLFNGLTGLRAKTGNYPGVTVDRRIGKITTPTGEVSLIDLPGSYSLHAISEDEAVTLNVLKGNNFGEAAPDAIVLVADATTLERSLPMIADVLLLGRPTLLALTMVDELKARGGDLDIFLLQKELGIPVVGVVGNKGLGIEDLRERLGSHGQWPLAANLPEESTSARFAWADDLLVKITRHPVQESGLTRRLDSVLVHPLWGGVVFLAFVTTFFQAIFTWATPAMDWMSGLMNISANWVLLHGPAHFLTQLLADGVLRGVGAVVVFVPQIALLFGMIFFFEASGYMARAAFVVDRMMGWVGLEGRCFIALLSSHACAIPGIMATRIIPSPRDRLATILAAPLTTCSARLPVYAILIATFVPSTAILGPITLQGLTLLGLYLLGGVSAVLCAAVFKKSLLKGASLPFYLELPPYRFPSFSSIAIQVWRRVSIFLRSAGKIILLGSVLLWFLLNFPRASISAGDSIQITKQQQIEQSYAADIGRAMGPIFSPLGFDWRINIGLLGSFAARELMISTMAQVYALDPSDGDFDGLGKILKTKDPKSGQPPMTFASAASLLVFFVYALLCLSTVAAVRKETESWKWPLFMLGYMFILAWSLSFLTYKIFQP